MRKKALYLTFGTMLAGGVVSVVNADEPLTLTADQMDQVTAGRIVSGLQINFVKRLEGIFTELQSGGKGMLLRTDLEGRLMDLQERFEQSRPIIGLDTNLVIGRSPD